MKKLQLLLLASAIAFGASAQEEEKSTIEFTPVHNIKTTPVKSQDRTGTCWSYATTSFIETEVLRQGGPELDLSEMYFVRYAYPEKARLYVMAHGQGNFSQGGQAHDVTKIIREYGMATEEAYPGRRDVTKPHNHSELASTQKALLDNYIKGRKASPSPVWYEVQGAILDIYLGEVPAKVDGKTPQEFAKAMMIDADNYVELTSYTHHPYYKAFNLEVPDNWSDDLYYNLPLDELIQVMDNALENGYSFAWDGDVSEKFFSHKQGAAIVPVDEEKGFAPQEEKEITPEVRQEAFLSWQSTDDHLMHITGLSKDQNGTPYYKTKNSWGTDRGGYEGYLYMSESYMRLHTVAIMVHKEAIPKAIKKKLGIK
ncbi:aminopeptidase [Carboxylicivirga sp. A043]|uniref:aminopeptidase C n=1 Tax=Carboxylicivirga litoralis TaxID=2816963 RepID=UPI0021CB807A|nr:C1 family peptidase [Carboxylicivirga sp. A043]MCU4155904.1 aminopeptidase [Carboxylicivirga sp. A043]